jgi:hypothetical protein
MPVKQAEEAALLAEQLHEKMYPQTPEADVEDTTPDDVVDTPAPDEPAPPSLEDVLEQLRVEKERYSSLKGKYDKEVPTLSNELKEFKQTVFERLEAARVTPDVVAPVEDKFAKFKEEYGNELFEVMKTLASETAEEKYNQTIKPVQEQVHSVEETQIKAAKQNFTSYLDDKVKGDWKNLWEGNDPKFIEFLESPDPSGLYTYADLVKLYNDNWDGDKLAKVFNLYLGDTPVVEIPEPPKPKAPNPAKEALVAPSRSTTHTTPTVNDKRIWTTDAMSEFQRKDRRGDYTPDESKAMWEDLLAAANEGRIK